MSGREELRRELEARAEATPPADLSSFEVPAEIAAGDRIAFARGLTVFREGDFYLAHDLWEEVWHGYRGADRLFLQGLIHIAVGSYHAQCGNVRGARSQLGKAAAKIGPFAPRHWGIAVDALLARAAALGQVDVEDRAGMEDALSNLREGVEPA